MLKRQSSFVEPQFLREQATTWRNPEDERKRSRTKTVNPHNFRKNNSHLYPSSKPHDKKVENYWDENGFLIQKAAENTNRNVMRRSASVLSMHPNIRPTSKASAKNAIQTSRTNLSNTQRPAIRKRTKKEQAEATIRLSTRPKAQPQRQKSVQPRRVSTDFDGFIYRQTKSTKIRNQQPEPEKEHKIQMCEGSKSYLRKSQKAVTHSVYDLRNRDFAEESLSVSNDWSFSLKPKLRRNEYRLTNMDLKSEKERKAQKLETMRQQYDAELMQKIDNYPKHDFSQFAPNEGEDLYIPMKYQPDSVYLTRKRIDSKINELRPIIQANKEEIQWSKAKKGGSKKKDYMPKYIRTIDQILRPNRQRL